MNQAEDDKMWMAYLDGQLTASEASAFDASLTPEERERLAGELSFEAALGRTLAAGVRCPEALWRRTEARLHKGRRRARFAPARFARAALAAAAGLVLVAGLYVMTTGQPVDAAFVLETDDVAQFAAQSEVAADTEAVRAFLRQNGVELYMTDFPFVRVHEMHLLGARKSKCSGDPTVVLLFNCCGHPAKIIVAPVDSTAASRMKEKAGSGDLMGLRVVGLYVLGLVSEHDARTLFQAFGTSPDDLGTRRPCSVRPASELHEI